MFIILLSTIFAPSSGEYNTHNTYLKHLPLSRYPESTSDVTDGRYAGKSARLVYGVFTTPVNSIGGSAVCAFSMDSILEVFQSAFKEQETINSNWLRVLPEKVPEPRPGACVNDSRTLPDITVNFVKAHPLMDDAVQSYFSLPVITKISFK